MTRSRELAQFPKLTVINIEVQAVGDEGFTVLADMLGLKQIGSCRCQGANRRCG